MSLAAPQKSNCIAHNDICIMRESNKPKQTKIRFESFCTYVDWVNANLASRFKRAVYDGPAPALHSTSMSGTYPTSAAIQEFHPIYSVEFSADLLDNSSPSEFRAQMSGKTSASIVERLELLCLSGTSARDTSAQLSAEITSSAWQS